TGAFLTSLVTVVIEFSAVNFSLWDTVGSITTIPRKLMYKQFPMNMVEVLTYTHDPATPLAHTVILRKT
ncbi:hypothetical protein CFP56_025812, partial [Quercus suber]